jgi:hypothetical protein
MDAFSLWAASYEYFDKSDMARRMRQMEVSFNASVTNGEEWIDHGVCGGLIFLAFATLYFRMWALPEDVDVTKGQHDALDAFRAGLQVTWNGLPVRYSSYDWWARIVWATAAVAFHNYLQRNVNLGKLRIKEDPLAYLAILVDCVQEWDRPPLPANDAPVLQASEVTARIEDGKFHIVYPPEYAKKVKKALGECLCDWNALVCVDGSAPS